MPFGVRGEVEWLHVRAAFPACAAGCYTLFGGRDIDVKGDIIDPASTGRGHVLRDAAGFWHAHVSEGDQLSYVLPSQDAGACRSICAHIRLAGGTRSLKAVA